MNTIFTGTNFSNCTLVWQIETKGISPLLYFTLEGVQGFNQALANLFHWSRCRGVPPRLAQE
jgi:hypothetical protein